MTIGDNSYGDTGEIGVLVPVFSGTNNDFAATTRPTLATVESWVDQVSGAVNSILAENGFAVPISQSDVKLMLDALVNQIVAEYVEGVNGSGKYGPAAMGSDKRHNKGRNAMMMEEVQSFVAINAVGLERLGATRTYGIMSGAGSRETDASGDTVAPLFQREDYGESRSDSDV